MTRLRRVADELAGCWRLAETPGWRWSSQSITTGKISRGAYRLQARSQWP